jgi:hypothetical protein
MMIARCALLALALSCAPQLPPAVGIATTTGVEMESDRARAIDAVVDECPRGNTECSPANAPRLPRARGPAPEGAAGFELAMTENEAQKHCYEAGQLWNMHSNDMAECSSSAGAKMPFEVNLQLCDGNVCRIVLSEPVNGQAIERWSQLDDELTTKYGPPGARELFVPDDCTKEGALASCLLRGRANVESAWMWSTGQGVSARLTAPSEQHVFLFVVYSDPAVARAVHVRGLWSIPRSER